MRNAKEKKKRKYEEINCEKSMKGPVTGEKGKRVEIRTYIYL